MSGESSSADSGSSHFNQKLIKTVSILLGEIIQENKEELKNLGKESLGKIILKKINIRQFLILKNHHR